MTTKAQRLRVILVTETYSPEIGGGERQAELLSRALARRGHAVTIATRRSRAGLRRRDCDGDIEVVRLPPTGYGRWRKWMLVPPALGLLLRARSGYDVVLVSGFRLLGIAAMLARAVTGKPTVLKADSRGELSGEYFSSGLALSGLSLDAFPVPQLLRLRNRLLRRADAFVVLSDEMTREMIDYGVPEDVVRAIPNGVDLERFRPASADERMVLRRRLGLPDGCVALYTGRLVSYKGLPLLLDVWRELESGTLVLVGEGGGDIHACETQLRDFVTAHGMNERVFFAGSVRNVEDWLRASDIFVFPTENEAFGLSLAEAMACGLPAATTTVGGLRDFVEPNVNAVAVPPGDGPALSAALQRLLGDEGLRQRLGSAARQRVVERFGAEAIAEAYESLFETLMSAQDDGVREVPK